MLFVGVVKTVDLSAAGVANSYMASVKETNYLFDVMHKGDGSPLATDHLGVIWKSASGLVQYLQMENGKASFYIGADTEDSNKILKGNAVIGAYDANDELIWSWHVWATDYDPEGENGSVELNGYTMMTRNLGALANGNATTCRDTGLLRSLLPVGPARIRSSGRAPIRSPAVRAPRCTTTAAAAPM